MIAVVLAFGVFLLSLVMHILLRRGQKSAGVLAQTLPEFVTGLAVTVCVLGLVVWYAPASEVYPVTAILLYVSLTAAYIVFAASPLLGDESPSSVIVLLARKKGSVTERDLADEFHDDALVDKRVNDLMRGLFIRKKNNRYYVLPKGRLLAMWLYRYRRILGIDLVG